MELEKAQTKLERALAKQQEEEAEAQAPVTEAQDALEQVQQVVDEFRVRVITDGLEKLTVSETYEVLRLLGAPNVSMLVIEKEQVDGEALTYLSEEDMEHALNITKLGDRRRLSRAIRTLANHQGFPQPTEGQPGALSWGIVQVSEWLRNEGFAQAIEQFAQQAIDGVVLLQLGPKDMSVLGLATVGQKSLLNQKLVQLKKQTYSGQLGGRSSNVSSSTTPATVASAEQMRYVLESVLEGEPISLSTLVRTVNTVYYVESNYIGSKSYDNISSLF